jgi:hypothetical protein
MAVIWHINFEVKKIKTLPGGSGRVLRRQE